MRTRLIDALRVLAVAGLVAGALPASAQDGGPNRTRPALEPFVARGEAAGAGVLVTDRDEILEHYAIGYAGHGVAMATYLGTLLGACLAGEQVDNPFAELPFPGAPLGLYDGRPWFLPIVGAWYKFLDWVS